MAMRSGAAALAVVSLLAACDRSDQLESAQAPEVATPSVATSTTPPPPGSVASTTEAPDDTPPPSTAAPDAPEPTPAPVERSITVGGMGADYGPPDHIVVDLGVSARSSSVAESAAIASAAGESMIAALTASGVAPSDIQTSQFSINTQHGPPDYSVISGYETTIGYRVRTSDVNELGAILGRAIDAGGNSVRAWSVRFEGDPADHMAAARASAWDDVRARAAATAAEIGEPLGSVLDVHEKVLVTSPQGMWQGGEGDSASFDIPVSPGVVGVVVLLTVTYAIGD